MVESRPFGGQIDRHARAGAKSAFQLDFAVMGFGEAFDNGETEFPFPDPLS